VLHVIGEVGLVLEGHRDQVLITEDALCRHWAGEAPFAHTPGVVSMGPHSLLDLVLFSLARSVAGCQRTTCCTAIPEFSHGSMARTRVVLFPCPEPPMARPVIGYGDYVQP
jgi:hypothetical protein